MLVAVGITTSDLASLNHREVTVSSLAALEVIHCAENATLPLILQSAALKHENPLARLAPGGKLRFKSLGTRKPDRFELFHNGEKQEIDTGWMIIRSIQANQKISLDSVKRVSASGSVHASYVGTVVLFVQNGLVRVALVVDLDKYVAGVLHSEIPASYNIEAVKAQAVAARTYGLNPRIDHSKDRVNVCDSFLCCQYFGGLTAQSSPTHLRAIHETARQVLTYQDRPILALFSSCAGGHTENYDNCFSDSATGQFPPPPRPYLIGVPESSQKMSFNLSIEKELRRFYSAPPFTNDAWSNHFKWHVELTAADIESHIHATAMAMLQDERAPFVVPPPSGEFGHIEGFSAVKRGVSGCIVTLEVKTSAGNWHFSKELVIRDLFKTPEKKLARLKSARIFFDHHRGNHDRISSVTISGLGWGHGVGMQQTGAQGWAKAGSNYRTILLHYFSGSRIDSV
ncbi:MAG: SpoIID/LytB domain-containing protein [Candidatus Obscuribacterales bacterium]|nr:SpoIID/LytB domain-containing protein [Candidatus Obscuribacterales bacterium]